MTNLQRIVNKQHNVNLAFQKLRAARYRYEKGSIGYRYISLRMERLLIKAYKLEVEYNHLLIGGEFL